MNKVKVLFIQSYLTLCIPMDSSLPGFSALGISQASILERVAIPFSKRSSQLRDQTSVSCIGRWILCHLRNHFSVYMSIPTSQFIPLHPILPLGTIGLFSESMTLYFHFLNKFICTIFLDSTFK